MYDADYLVDVLFDVLDFFIAGNVCVVVKSSEDIVYQRNNKSLFVVVELQLPEIDGIGLVQ